VGGLYVERLHCLRNCRDSLLRLPSTIRATPCTTPTYAVIDLSVTKRLPLDDDIVSIIFGARNIADDYQYDFDSGPDRDSGYLYGPRFPRTLYATLSCDF